ncbi:MAG: beta-N-acetylhexosaminidase, partial [Flavisolibacter sp.]
MRKITILFLMFLCVLEGKAGAPGKDPGIALIPQPVSCARGKGQFLLTPQTRVVISESDSSCKDIAGFLADRLHLSALYRTEVQLEGRKTSVIRLQLNKKRDSILGKEGYLLEVKPSGVRIRANGPQGWFYGIQTFLQLLPASIEAGKAVPYQTWSVPAVTIKDYPRFAYRGLMLDVSRHFFPKDMLLAYINQMAKYKFNSFHLHLTDDQGWRIAIRGLPRLTEVGAWRVPRTGYWDNSIEPPVAGEQATCGGYYTVEDIQEIVHYAARRCITVIPEIDVPAHCLALIASYPQLSCSGLPVLVNPGTPWNDQQENVLCAGNDSVYLVLDQILSQVAGLFPGKYIHIGGDEAVKTFWNRCPKCRKRMQQEHLGSAADLQSYFIKRIARIVESKGKKVIGWDE